MRTMWRLWRLLRALEKASGAGVRAVSFQIVGEPQAHLDERRRVAKALGESEPKQQFAWEVGFWPNCDVAQSTTVTRGRTVGEALGFALEALG